MSKVRDGWMAIKNVSGLLYDYRENRGLPVAVMSLGKVRSLPNGKRKSQTSTTGRWVSSGKVLDLSDIAD